MPATLLMVKNKAEGRGLLVRWWELAPCGFTVGWSYQATYWGISMSDSFIFSLGLVGPQRRPFQSPARILGAEWKNLGVSDSPFPLLFFRIPQSSIVLPQRVISVSCHGDGGAVRCWKGRSLGTPYLLNRISPPSPHFRAAWYHPFMPSELLLHSLLLAQVSVFLNLLSVNSLPSVFQPPNLL